MWNQIQGLIFYVRFFFKGNELTDLSLNYFLLALQYQKTYLDIHKLQPNQGTGILRLIFSVRLLHLIYLKWCYSNDFISSE